MTIFTVHWCSEETSRDPSLKKHAHTKSDVTSSGFNDSILHLYTRIIRIEQNEKNIHLLSGRKQIKMASDLSR
jgi:hypothetical protein